jgi:hypothetical protein
MNLRLLALAGVVACAVALPLAVATAGQPGDEGRTVAPAAAPESGYGGRAPDGDGRGVGARGDDGRRASGHGDGRYDDGREASGHGDEGRDAGARDGDGAGTGGQPAPSARPGRSPLLLGLGLATAARCGPGLTSPDGIEAQTCVLAQGDEAWARTYYRNATGHALAAVLSLMGPGGRTVQMHCEVGAEDEPAMCETPRVRTRTAMDGYTAVAEFAATAGQGPLLLRAGSNAPAPAER